MLKPTRKLLALICATAFVVLALGVCGCSATSSSSGGGAGGSSESTSSENASSESVASSSASADSGSSSASSASGDASAMSGHSDNASKSASSSGVTTKVTTDYPGPAFVNKSVPTIPVETDIPENSSLLFGENQDARILNHTMEQGKIPMRCNIWSEEEGNILSIDVVDPDQIVQIYNLLSKMTVGEKSDMSSLDSGYRLMFDLINGLEVSFSFEDRNLLDTEDGNYTVQGGEELWKLIGQIQAEYWKKVEARGLRNIIADKRDVSIESYPSQAVPGDLVIVKTTVVTDGAMNVYANGVKAENWGDFCFTFTMPDADVRISSGVSSPPGGGLA